MPGRPLFTRVTIVLAVCMLLAIPFPAQIATAGSIWHEGPTEFANGTMENVSLKSGNLSLSVNRSVFDNWTQLSTGIPSHPYSAAMVYDSVDSEFILFGGMRDYDEYSDQTWIYNPSQNKWENMNPSISPPERARHIMAYDNKRDEVVIYGGKNWNRDGYDNVLSDTWTYNITKNEWREDAISGGPSGPYDSAMAYDSAHDKIITFGGLYGWARGDTRVFDPATNIWTEITPSSSPPARSAHSMVYDDARSEVVMFGGWVDIAPYSVNDTWTFNLTTNEWKDQKPASSPPSRIYHAMTYDDIHNQVILFGGCNINGTMVNDTWTYDLSTNIWTNTSSSTAPPPRQSHTMAFDSTNDDLVLFGGYTQSDDFGDLWIYDLWTNNWSNRDPAPMARDGQVMAPGVVQSKIILFGGDSYYGYLNDTWTYDMSTDNWTNMHPGISPPARGYGAMIFDDGHEEAFLFGGTTKTSYFNDTWAYNLTANKWTNMTPSVSPPVRAGHTMVYDCKTGEIILFGGYDGNFLLNDTWIYNMSKNEWTNISSPAAPQPRTGHSMVFDTMNGEIILFGGNGIYGYMNDTWTYNLTTNIWFNKTSSIAPPARSGHAMAFDPTHNEVVMFGGEANPLFNDTWTYNLSTNTWIGRNPPIAPSIRAFHSMIYDNERGDIILFGGWRGGDDLSDMWTYNYRYGSITGNYTSGPYDANGTAFFGTLSWEADLPQNTSIRLQFRSSDTIGNLTAKLFLGPDGTVNSFYDVNGQQINSINNGARWFQYRAFFGTNDFMITPILRSVSVNYNLLQNVKLLSPTGGENWTGIQTITWNASDPDNDSLFFDIYLENATSSLPLALNLTNETRAWNWNTSSVPTGVYRIKLIVRDDDPLIPLSVEAISGNFTVSALPPPNRPPHIVLVSPANNSIVNTTTIRLIWQGSDPDGDNLTYTVYYSNLPLFEDNWTSTITQDGMLFLANLADNTTYYWTVDASDGINDHTDIPAEVWSFTVNVPVVIPPPVNHPPKITSIPPTNATVGVEYIYDVTAIDPDNDLINYSLINPPAGMKIDADSGGISWIPTSVGTFNVIIVAEDNQGAADTQSFSVAVTSPFKPFCIITYPINGNTVSGRIIITGSAVRGTFPLERVEVRIDNNDWIQASGLENWTLSLDTNTLANGHHKITARAFGGQLYSDNAVVTVTVNNAPSHVIPPSNHPITIDLFPWLILLLIIIVIGVAVVLYFKSRRWQ